MHTILATHKPSLYIHFYFLQVSKHHQSELGFPALNYTLHHCTFLTSFCSNLLFTFIFSNHHLLIHRSHTSQTHSPVLCTLLCSAISTPPQSSPPSVSPSQTNISLAPTTASIPYPPTSCLPLPISPCSIH